MKLLFAVFSSILLFDGIIKGSTAQTTCNEVIQDFYDKLKKMIKNNKQNFAGTSKELSKTDQRRSWRGELQKLFESTPTTDASARALDPVIIPVDIIFYVKNLSESMPHAFCDSINFFMNGILNDQAKLQSLCDGISMKILCDQGIESPISGVHENKTMGNITSHIDFITNFKTELHTMKYRHTKWRNSFEEQVTEIIVAKDSLIKSTASIKQNLENVGFFPVPDMYHQHVLEVVQNYSNTYQIYSDGIDCLNRILSHQDFLRNSWIATLYELLKENE